jgi:disulfide oxidoreductase YuzD
MRIPDPFDIISTAESMRLRETQVYYRGWLMYDMEVKPREVALLLWKMSYTVNLLVDEGIITTMAKRMGEGDYIYYMRKVKDELVSDETIRAAEIVSSRTNKPKGEDG